MSDSNLDVYADPTHYDRISSPFDPDGSMLLSLASEAEGPVLELGCGTGRVTIPLARRGIEMTGLDVLPAMIERAKGNAQDLSVRWVCADVRSFDLGTRYALIFTRGLLFQHLLTRADQEAMLSCARQHLAPGGRLLLDVSFKRPDTMTDMVQEKVWYSYTDKAGRKVPVTGTDVYDHIEQVWTQTMYHRWHEGGELRSAPPVKLTLRYLMPREMETLLFYNGFSVQARYGDWDGSPLTEDSDVQIYLCTRRQGA